MFQKLIQQVFIFVRQLVGVIIFLIPIIGWFRKFYLNFFKARKSATNFVNYVENHGLIRATIKSKYVCFQALSFLISPFYIKWGWIWAAITLIPFGILFLLSFANSDRIKMPKPGSDDFDKLIKKRKKSALGSLVLLLLWILSWVS